MGLRYILNLNDPAKVYAYNQELEELTKKANDIYVAKIQNWKNELHTPTWSDIYNSIDNPQRFLNILNESGIRNKGQIPLLFASDEKNYYAFLENSNELITIAKNGKYFNVSLVNGGSEKILQESKFNYSNTENNVTALQAFSSHISALPTAQYELSNDGSFSRWNPSNELGVKGGTKIAFKMIDISNETRNAPKMTLSEDGNFEFISSKTGISLSLAPFLELGINKENLSKLIKELGLDVTCTKGSCEFRTPILLVN